MTTDRVDRRSVLALTAGAGLAASVLVLPGCSGASEKPNDKNSAKGEAGDGEVTANEDLMREHGVLRRILIAYREVSPKLITNPAGVDVTAIASAATLFRDFGEHYHEQLLEEQHIFPIVKKARGVGAALVDALLAQHARGREITNFVLDRTRAGRIATGDGEALATALTAFSRMYEAHAAREDTVIFPVFKTAIGPNAYAELGEQFEAIEHREFGGDGFDIAIAKIADIEHALGISDLGAFTAPRPAA